MCAPRRFGRFEFEVVFGTYSRRSCECSILVPGAFPRIPMLAGTADGVSTRWSTALTRPDPGRSSGAKGCSSRGYQLIR